MLYTQKKLFFGLPWSFLKNKSLVLFKYPNLNCFRRPICYLKVGLGSSEMNFLQSTAFKDFKTYSVFLQYHSLVNIHTTCTTNKEISYEEYKKLQSKGITVIDVRDNNEIKSSGTIPGSLNIPSKYFSKKNMPSVEEEFRHLDYTQLNDITIKGNSIVIDVREKSELDETGKIPGSHHIPLGEVEKALLTPADDFEKLYNFKKPNPDDSLVFSCRSGKRSLVALEKALNHGFNNAKHYSGGWLDWEKNSSEPK